MKAGWLWLAMAAAGVAATAWLLWGTALPLGIPGEWTWVRLGWEADLPWNLVLTAPAAIAYLAAVFYGSRRLEFAGRAEAMTWVAGLGIAAFAWLWLVQEAGPTPQRLSKGPFVLFYPQSSGYFFKVRYESPALRPFLSGYEQLMAEGDVLHVGTHPPGLFLLFFGLRDACQASPALTDLVLATQPESAQLANESVVENSAASHPPRSVTRSDLAALWLAYLLAQALVAGVVWPLYGLLRRTQTRPVAFLLAAFWPLVPAAAIFLPKSDAAYAGLAVAWLWCWLTAVDRESWGRAATAGALAWCSLLCSLAFLPVFLMGAAAALLEPVWSADRRSGWLRVAGLAAVSAMTFLLLTGLFWWATDVNLFRVWLQNYRNHAGFYDQFPRSYLGWLLLNPPELLIAAGVPLCLLAVAGLAGLSRSGSRERALACGIAGVWGLLWLTGKNSGEAARLWLPFMPWLAILAGPAVRSLGASLAAPQRILFLGLVLQMLAQLLTVLRVGGFHFEG